MKFNTRLKNWTEKSISNQLYLIFIFSILLTVLLSIGATYSISFHIFRRQAEEYNSQILRLFSEKMDTAISQVEKLSYFMYQDEVLEIINSPEISPAEKAHQSNVLALKYKTWETMLDFDLDINNIYYINDNDIMLEIPWNSLPKKDYTTQTWYENAKSAMGKIVYYSPSEITDLPTDGMEPNDFRFAAARWINNPQSPAKGGVLLIDISVPHITSIMENMGIKGSTQLFLMESSGECLYSVNASETPGFFLSNASSAGNEDILSGKHGRYLINRFTSAQTQWNYLMATDYRSLTEPSRKISMIILLIGIIICFFSIKQSRIFIFRITDALRELQDSMQKVIGEDFSSRIDIREKNEIMKLKVSFNTMIDRIDILINSVYKEQLKEKQAKLNALQSQINPHFLYNTLGTIGAMAILHNNTDIYEMSNSLSDMFRYATKQQDKLVPFRKEYDNLKNYISIQHFRYGERLQFISDIPEELLAYKILSFTLQPIVENAIIHGIEPKPEGGKIIMKASCLENILTIKIEDNGIGIPEDKLTEIKASINNAVNSAEYTSEYIGLQNVSERLFLFYGSTASLTLQSRIGEGTVCILHIPV